MSVWELYDALIDSSRSEAVIDQLILGLSWSAAASTDAGGEASIGLCFSPQGTARTLPWAGSLQGQSVNTLAEWIYQWEPAAAVVGALAINSAINHRSRTLANAQSLDVDGPKHLQVFNYFRPQLATKKVAVIGHYPGLEAFPECAQWHCIERNVRPGDLPDPAVDFIVPEADWVFISASSIANKTLPHLLRVAAQSKVVLMGPSLPWMDCWSDFNVDYLAGVAVTSAKDLWPVVAEGGGTRLFEQACEYKIASTVEELSC